MKVLLRQALTPDKVIALLAPRLPEGWAIDRSPGILSDFVVRRHDRKAVAVKADVRRHPSGTEVRLRGFTPGDSWLWGAPFTSLLFGRDHREMEARLAGLLAEGSGERVAPRAPPSPLWSK